MVETIKELKGHSGSKIYLMKDGKNKYFIRKTGNVKRNFERLTNLKNIISVPEIYRYDENEHVLDMEYIHGMDMKGYLDNNSPRKLIDFLLSIFEVFSQKSHIKNYIPTYKSKIGWINEEDDIPFMDSELISKLPDVLPQSTYCGDLTLENIIYGNNKFYLIDQSTVEYDSYIFDIAKLRQDLDSQWFLRYNQTINLNSKLRNIKNEILKNHPIANNDYLIILMLLRIYLHSPKNTLEYDFVIGEINNLWK